MRCLIWGINLARFAPEYPRSKISTFQRSYIHGAFPEISMCLAGCPLPCSPSGLFRAFFPRGAETVVRYGISMADIPADPPASPDRGRRCLSIHRLQRI